VLLSFYPHCYHLQMPRIPTFSRRRTRSLSAILSEANRPRYDTLPRAALRVPHTPLRQVIELIETPNGPGTGASTRLELRPAIDESLVPPIPAHTQPGLAPLPSVPAPSSSILAPHDAVLIKKPPTQEYQNLEVWLKWQSGQYQDTRNYILELAQQHLDLRHSLHQQPDKTKVEFVSREASLQYPFLLSYEGDWVCKEILRRYLKNTSARRNGKARA